MGMKRIRNILFYIIIIGGFTVLIHWIVQLGENNLQSAMNVITPETEKSQWSLFLDAFFHNFSHPLAILLLQIVTIILVARLFSWGCRKIGQPAVIGEIAAGIVLGPSLVGMYFPEFSTFLFPEQSLGNLGLLSQIGLILFMFVVGMELDLKVLRKQAHEAVVISHASIIIPFALGVGLAYFIYQSFAPQGVPFVSFALFLGIAMSITAFPVLARIVQERGIHKTKLGTVVLTCAAADDITAWSLLAVVIAIVRAGSFISALPTIIMAVAYVFVLLKVVRPFLKRIGDLHASHENLSKPVVAIFFLVLIISAYTTEIIGIHALFGAFMAGTIMPDNQKFKKIFIEKVEDVALVLLLPLFFVFTGLRTQIGLLNDPYLWKVCGLVILVAVTGKFVGSALAARYIGQNWRDSLTIGALMNTRGLVELVALNIGYDLGIMTPEIFAMLVIMALVTTFMTSPSLHLIDKIFTKKETSALKEIEEMNKYRILISFGKPEMGRTLLRLAHGLIRSKNGNSLITALHLSPNNLFNTYKIDGYEKEGFAPVLSESKKLGQPIETLYKVSEDIETNIAETANNGNYNLLLMGIGHSIYKGSLLGNLLEYPANILNPERLLDKATGREKLFGNSPFAETTRQILAKSKVPVGILVDDNLLNIGNIFLPIFSEEDGFLIEYGRQFITSSSAQITVFDAVGSIRNNTEMKESLRMIEQHAPNHLIVMEKTLVENNYLKQHDLMLISLESWKKLVDSNSIWLKNVPSVLIMKN
jgi:Kef-type K+ transport system membrane component KefB